jgi:hypothetical protein
VQNYEEKEEEGGRAEKEVTVRSSIIRRTLHGMTNLICQVELYLLKTGGNSFCFLFFWEEHSVILQHGVAFIASRSSMAQVRSHMLSIDIC